MRSPDEVALVERLAAEGLNPCQVARVSGIPRGTVRDWLVGRGPPGIRDGADCCSRCGHARHSRTPLDQPTYSYLLGMYLGDGCISTMPRGVYRLRIACDGEYPSIIEEVAAAIGKIVPVSKVGIQRRKGSGCVEVYSYSKAWPCLFPQHGSGPKHERRIFLESWQEEIVETHPEGFVRGLLHSDGCRVRNRVKGKEYPRYFFSQVSDDIRALFCGSLDQLGIRYTRSAPKHVSIARAVSVRRLDEFVGPKRGALSQSR